MKTAIKGFTESDVVTVTNSSGTAYVAGQVIVVGDRLGICVAAIAAAASGAVNTEGVFALTKATGFTLAVGQKISWDATNSRVTTALTTGIICEVYKAAATGDTTVQVRINCSTRGRVYKAVVTPSAGEDTANQVDLTLPFPVAGCLTMIQIYNSSGVQRVAGTVTVPSTYVLRIAEANIAATDKIHVWVEEVVGA